MNKRRIIQSIVAHLVGELEVYTRAAQAAHAEATDEQSKAEHKYDTRGLEASYLARGQSRQAADLEAAIAAFQKLDARKFKDGEGIDIGALVELDHDGERTFYFIGPKAGGTEITYNKQTILVITPKSPLGEQLQGRKQGDRIQLILAGARSDHQIIKVL
jgi:transcription elongation GreA/GreB family factor